MRFSKSLWCGFLFACVSVAFTGARAQVPTPVSVLGHTPGDDFYLADYEDAVRYFHAAAAATDRMKMFSIGKTTEGREIEIGVISSPANLARLDEYKKNARRLAVADNLTDEQARQLAHDSKVIVHIDGGLHSDEVAGGQHSIMLAYKLLSAKNDPEVDAILDNVILVLWPTLNPDGQDMVTHWYRQNVGTKYEVAPMPWLYQDYVGHDNNRDGYMLNMKESQVLVKAELDWSPEIFYCQHQTAPFPARIWIPPFADPISSNISPYVRSWLNVVGTNMTAYLDAHQMPGAISETRFDNWYAGFNDWVHVFRNEISFFTETGLYRYATPRFYTVNEFPKETQDLRALSMYSEPWEGGWWRIGDAVNYMIGGSMSVLDLAAKNHETLLFNRYQAARDNIAHYKKEGPFAYVISDKQADTPEAGLLAQKMIENGLKVYATKTGFAANGVTYPVGSWVIPMDQPFSGLVKELFERQRYPDEIELGTSKAVDLPYDVTGWTLPLQMGVAVDTVSDPLTTQQLGLMEPVEDAKVPAAEIAGGGDVFVISRRPNASYAVVNEVLKQGGSVAMSKDAIATPEGKERGAFVIRGLGRGAMDGVAKKYGVSVAALTAEPGNVIAIKKARVGLYRPWAPSIDEGWTRWILENYGFEPKSIYNADMRSSELHARYDVIVLPDMSRDQLMEGFHVGMVPGQYAGGIGPDGVDNLRAFVREGGMLVASNRTAANLIPLMSLPLKDVLEGVKSDKFFCSGALLRVEQQSAELPVNFGVPEAPVVMFQRGPAFVPEAGFQGAILAKYAKGTNPLESGLLLHPEAIEDKAAAVELQYGKGRIVLYGFKPEFRGQAHGTYRYLFNALYLFDQPELPVVKVPAAPAPEHVAATAKATVEEPDEY
ncbi:M14 metallopeptidase family protein [Granulicella sp. L46]|uniref:M14 family metallopeptidase n=1 Tax=Granulicella sp. L46 TaxID=1641865 RepID=UPI00131E6B4F|nr:M14 metallopeptidase family protein [Granulicella sp. L46]